MERHHIPSERDTMTSNSRSHFHPASLRMAAFLWAAAFLLLLPVHRLEAFPPAPHHTIYGQVRDEFGNPLVLPDALVYLVTGTGAVIEGAVTPGLEPGINYSLSVPMDSGIASDLYRPTALKPTLPFTMRVKVFNTIYLPIEMKGDYKNIGRPGGRTRIDLTLGEDSDNDGIPDAWERALIAMLGGNRTLADIRADGDDDGDGMSNLNEYLAGSYAFDPEDGFRLNLERFNGNVPVLKFTSLPGRNYQVLSSTDLADWSAVRIRVPADGPDAEWGTALQASEVRILEVEAEPSVDPAPRFFKLIVQ